MKKLIAIALVGATLTGCATTQSQGESIGAIAGAVIGSRFGHGAANLVATAAGGVLGSQVGRELSTPRGNVLIMTPVDAYGYQHQGEDHCINDQMVKGSNYGVAASYCRGIRERKVYEQQMMERNAYQRGYQGR